MTDSNVIGILLGIAGVSSVFWTGALIVLQIRIKDGDEILNIISAAMACSAFGALAPLFAVLAPGATLRTLAVAFAAFYFALTIAYVGKIFSSTTSRARIGFAGLFLPTVAMIGVAVWPQQSALQSVVAWLSVTLDFLGYFVLFYFLRA